MQRTEAQTVFGDINYTKLTKGATFVPVHVAMAFHRQEVDDNVSAVNEDNGIPILFPRSWPVYLFPCQTASAFGARYPAIPSLKSTGDEDTRLIWCLLSLLSRIEPLWYLTCHSELSTGDWKGWILIYLTFKCFHSIAPRKIQNRKDPFKRSKVDSIINLASKVREQSLHDCFSSLSEVLCPRAIIRNTEDVTPLILPDIHEIIILRFECASTPEPPMFPPCLLRNNTSYELRFVLRQWDLASNTKWDGEVYGRHGGSFNKWWYQRRKDSLATHSDGITSLIPGAVYMS